MTETSPKPPDPSSPAFVRRSPKAVALFVVAALGLTALDLGSKAWAEDALSRPRMGEAPPVCEPGDDGWSEYQRLRGDSIPLVEDILELEYAENCGAAFSLLHSAPQALRRGVFSLAALAACIALTVMFVQGRGGVWFAVGAPMVVSGALGNLVDRVRYGYVVDFIHFHWHDAFDYPVFNIADIGVVVGVVLLLIDGVRHPDPAAPAPQPLADRAPAAGGEGRAADDGAGNEEP
jgi:signal peptidase II